MSSNTQEAATVFGSCPLPIMQTNQILLGHGSGGKLTAELIESIILPALKNPILETLDDQAVLNVDNTQLAFTTDSYVVTPLFFPGGNIGELAVNGTINDLAMGGAEPIALSLAFILEEGLPMAEFQRVVDAVRVASRRAGVPIVTGDTKVVGRGAADKLFINTSGVGKIAPDVRLSSSRVTPGDAILVSGTIGDHGVSIMSCREGVSFGGDLRSDTAPLHGLVKMLLARCPEIHAMRDPTRGGVAATLVEIATRRQLGMEIEERLLPINDAVRGASEMLGLDPLLIANEGKLIAFVPKERESIALAALREHPLGRNAACIGHVTDAHAGRVFIKTTIGGQRVVDLPFGEVLPRIC